MTQTEEARRRIQAALDPRRVADLAQGALRIRSPSGEEKEVAEYFAREMRGASLDVDLQSVPASGNMTSSSWNAIGRLRGKGGGATLMFNGHLDHNPVSDGWSKDPFGGVIEDGWLYGFVHMKAANAAYLAAAEAVIKSGIQLDGDVILANVCGELRGGIGTRYALDLGLTADYFVVGEPTELELCFTHTASLILIVHVYGRTKHYSTLEVDGQRGVNAVEKIAGLITRLGVGHRLQAAISAGGWLTYEANANFPAMPQTNIGSMRAGIGAAYDTSRAGLFPDHASLVLDVRPVPGMSIDSIAADLRKLLDAMAAEDEGFRAEIEIPGQGFTETFRADPNSRIADAIRSAHERHLGEAPRLNSSFLMAASDASWLSHAGIPGLVYGPAGRYLSRPDERVKVDDIVNAARIYADAIFDICGSSNP